MDFEGDNSETGTLLSPSFSSGLNEKEVNITKITIAFFILK